jgi:hypothetical protein
MVVRMRSNISSRKRRSGPVVKVPQLENKLLVSGELV